MILGLMISCNEHLEKALNHSHIEWPFPPLHSFLPNIPIQRTHRDNRDRAAEREYGYFILS